MKKIYLIIVTIILITLLTSCNINRFNTKDRIIAPENNLPPLQGKWIIDKSIDSPYKKGDLEEIETLIGKEVLFHKEAVVVGDDFAVEPTYKLKKVSMSDFLLYKYKTNPEHLNLEDKKAQVITIYSNNQYFYEFIKYSDDEMLIFDEDKFYFLKKNVEQISKEEIDRYISVEKNIMRISNIQEVDTLRSGVLLGIKSYYFDEMTQTDNWKYRTVWLRANNRSIASVYEINNLLVPRKKGFWLVAVERDTSNNGIRDRIDAIQKGKIKEEYSEDEASFFMTSFLERGTEMLAPSILKNILYIGNDYVSTETINLLNNRKTLEVYPIDYLKDEKPIKISDIIGSDGLQAFKEGAQSVTKADSSIFINEESFGLSRRNGYWIMKGRLNYENSGEELYKEYNIKTIPPKELVNYDELVMSWNKIKSKVPEAIDAFTSPNEDIIIIVTRNNLLIYAINDHEISQQELGRIKISSSESIVMAEWAIGRYTMLWEEEILKNEAQTVKY